MHGDPSRGPTSRDPHVREEARHDHHTCPKVKDPATAEWERSIRLFRLLL
jgi:hypothetical protein